MNVGEEAVGRIRDGLEIRGGCDKRHVSGLYQTKKKKLLFLELCCISNLKCCVDGNLLFKTGIVLFLLKLS